MRVSSRPVGASDWHYKLLPSRYRAPLCQWMLVPFCRMLFLQEADSRGREEWMLVPPKSLGVQGAIKTLNPTNRKFQT